MLGRCDRTTAWQQQPRQATNRRSSGCASVKQTTRHARVASRTHTGQTTTRMLMSTVDQHRHRHTQTHRHTHTQTHTKIQTHTSIQTHRHRKIQTQTSSPPPTSTTNNNGNSACLLISCSTSSVCCAPKRVACLECFVHAGTTDTIAAGSGVRCLFLSSWTSCRHVFAHQLPGLILVAVDTVTHTAVAIA
jgi:hypothetical protein